MAGLSPRGTGKQARPAPRAAAPPRARLPRDSRLGAVDWIEAGQNLLRKHGISAVKLAALTAELGVSTGSFYHHFTDFEQYLGALADHYSVERVERLLDQARTADDGRPLSRLEQLARLSLRDGTFELDRAMRIWGTMDRRAATAMRRAETLVLAFVGEVFEGLGFTRSEAALRARILLSINVSPLLHHGEEHYSEFFKQSLQLLADTTAIGQRAAAPVRRRKRVA